MIGVFNLSGPECGRSLCYGLFDVSLRCVLVRPNVLAEKKVVSLTFPDSSATFGSCRIALVTAALAFLLGRERVP